MLQQLESLTSSCGGGYGRGEGVAFHICWAPDSSLGAVAAFESIELARSVLRKHRATTSRCAPKLGCDMHLLFALVPIFPPPILSLSLASSLHCRHRCRHLPPAAACLICGLLAGPRLRGHRLRSQACPDLASSRGKHQRQWLSVCSQTHLACQSGNQPATNEVGAQTWRPRKQVHRHSTLTSGETAAAATHQKVSLQLPLLSGLTWSF